jgi:predicted transcriptional regulator
MKPHDVRKQRLELGYSVPMLAEVLRVEPRTVCEWESGAGTIPDWLMPSLGALMQRQARRDEIDMLESDGTFTSRRRIHLMSKLGFSR